MLSHLPFREQFNMGLTAPRHFFGTPHFSCVLAIIFLLTALAFIPVGQLCCSLMERAENLPAYGLNLLGSLAGVLLIFAFSAFWTPQLERFVLSFAATLLFFVHKRASHIADSHAH